MEQLLRAELRTATLRAFGSPGGGCISEGRAYDTDTGPVFVKVNHRTQVRPPQSPARADPAGAGGGARGAGPGPPLPAWHRRPGQLPALRSRTCRAGGPNSSVWGARGLAAAGLMRFLLLDAQDTPLLVSSARQAWGGCPALGPEPCSLWVLSGGGGGDGDRPPSPGSG